MSFSNVGESADQNCSSSLGRIETKLMTALKRQEAEEEATQVDEDDIDEQTPLTRSITTATTLVGGSVGGPGVQGIRRNITGTTLVDPGPKLPQDSPSLISEEDTDELGVSYTPMSRKEWPSPDKPILTPAGNPNLDNKINGGPFGSFGRKSNDVVEIVQEAMKELSIIRQKEQSLRPLRVFRQDKNHQPDDSLKKQFQQLANDELQIRRLNARDWLRVATWWLLKV